MERIEIARGRWVRFARPMYISDRRAMASVSDMGEDATLLEVFDRIIGVIEPAIAERSWEGPFDQLTPDELQDIGRAWRDQTEDAALPPDDGTSSGTTSPAGV
jgi:hypothetical protein